MTVAGDGTYRYRAARADGRIVRGAITASSSADGLTRLLAQGLHPLALEAVDPARLSRRAANRRDLALAFRSVASLVGAGVPLERALAGTEALAGEPLRSALVGAGAALREGRTFAESLAASNGVIPPIAIDLVAAGERASQLPRALDELADHLEREAELSARVRQALAYPLLLAVAGAVSVGVITTVVIPKFADMLAEAGQQLPAATRMLLGSAALIRRAWLPGLLGCTLAVVSFAAWAARPEGRLRWHRWQLALPVLGPVRHALATARVCRALAGMLAAGMPLLAALAAARGVAGDAAVADRIGRAAQQVTQGRPLTAALTEERAFRPHALQLVAVGESSGQLAVMLRRAGDLAAADADRLVSGAVRLLEPALVVLFGGLIAFVAAALLQAVYSLRPGLS
jgi:type II secretory pathway component PulF